MKERKASESLLLAQWFVREVLGETWDWQRHKRHIKMAGQTLAGNTLEDVKDAIRLRQQAHRVFNIFEAKYVDRASGQTYLELARYIPPQPAAGQYGEWAIWLERYAARAALRGDKVEVPPQVAEYLRANHDHIQAILRQRDRDGSAGARAVPSREKVSRSSLPRPTRVAWSE